MKGFATHQTGVVGDMTAGLPPYDYGQSPSFEWYGDQNGRIVIELQPGQVKVLGRPRPCGQEKPNSREQQQENMVKFLGEVSNALAAMGFSQPVCAVVCRRLGQGEGKTCVAARDVSQG